MSYQAPAWEGLPRADRDWGEVDLRSHHWKPEVAHLSLFFCWRGGGGGGKAMGSRGVEGAAAPPCGWYVHNYTFEKKEVYIDIVIF